MHANTTENFVCGALFAAAAVTSVIVAWRYAEATINRFAFIATCMGFTVGLSTIILVPYDIWSATARDENSELDQAPLSRESIRHGWSLLYWTTAVICYLLIPVLMEFENAGDFRFHMRIKTALKRNLVWYVIYLVFAVFAYAFIPNKWRSASGGSEQSLSIVGFYIALSNTVGLVILTLLMGFGLVGLPRSLWRASDKTGKLAKLYADLSAQNAVKQAAVSKLKEAILQVERDIEPFELMFKQAESASEPLYDVRQDDMHVQEALGILNGAVCRSKDLCKELGFADERRGGQGAERNSWLESSFYSAVRGQHTPRMSGTPASKKNADLEPENLPIAAISVASVNRYFQRRDENGNHDSERAIIDRMDKKQLLNDMRDLTKLNANLKSLNLQARRASHRFQKLTQSCLALEDLDGLVDEAQVDTPGSQWSERLQLYAASWSHTRNSWLCCSGCCRRLLRKSYWARVLWRRYLLFWHRTLRPVAIKMVSCLAAALSLFIVMGQLTMFAESFKFCSIFALLIEFNDSFWAIHAICLLPLGYMGYAVAWSIFRMRIFNWYGLYPGRNTDASSLLWCATLVTRLTVPLGYHFLLLVRVQSTSFEDFMRPMRIVPVLGDAFNKFFPLFVAILCLSNIVGVYSRLVQCLGFKSLEFSDGSFPDWACDAVAEGKELVKLVRRRRFENGVVELQRQAGDVRALRTESDVDVPEGILSDACTADIVDQEERSPTESEFERSKLEPAC